MWLLDTNILIHCNKLKIKPFRKDFTFTTIFSLIEFPIASKYTEISIVNPTSLHYNLSLKYALMLRKKGTPIPAIDIITGAIAVEKNFYLVSEDSDFRYFQDVEPRLKIISLDNYIDNIQKKNQN